MVVVIDYGMGNLGSVLNMIKKIGYKCTISSEKDVINSANKLILPGVGSFDNGINQLKKYNLVDLLNKKVLVEKTPILGICLGMQLMTNSSEEGSQKGLGWIDAETKKFNFKSNKDLKIPHMGWNYINLENKNPLFNNLSENSKFYFVHSYYVKCKDVQNSIAFVKYGHKFTCAFAKNNIMATQFHPEKSHKYGYNLLKNFLEL
tara:strand:+ start:1639 stop:2250 length:612 start_codon:yes stop_codon:yes gene_type:complete